MSDNATQRRPWGLAKFVAYGLLVVAALVSIFPLYVMILGSLRSFSDMFDSYLPTNLTLSAYRDLFSTNRDIPVSGQIVLNFVVPFWRSIANSLLISLSYALLTLTLCAMAGFAFAKYQFPGKQALFILVLLTMMIPSAATIIPLFYIMQKIGWIDTYQAVIVPGAASAFGVFWMRQYMQSLPNELLDAGRLDGCSSLRLFLNIVLPLCRPGLAALGIFLFVTSWTDFLWPLLILQSEAHYTIPVFLGAMSGTVNQPNPIGMAGSTFATVPIILIFIFFQRHFISGISAGALK